MPTNYFELCKQLLIKEKESYASNEQGLEGLVASLISVDRGIGIVQSVNPGLSREDVLDRMIIKDLFYLSLAEELPEGVNPLEGDYRVTTKGIHFKVEEKKEKTAKFVFDVDYFIQSSQWARNLSINEVMEEVETLTAEFTKRAVDSAIIEFMNSHTKSAHMKDKREEVEAAVRSYIDFHERFVQPHMTSEKLEGIVSGMKEMLEDPKTGKTKLTGRVQSYRINVISPKDANRREFLEQANECPGILEDYQGNDIGFLIPFMSRNLINGETIAADNRKGLVFSGNNAILIDPEKRELGIFHYDSKYKGKITKELRKLQNKMKRGRNYETDLPDNLKERNLAFAQRFLNTLEKVVTSRVESTPYDELSTVERRMAEMQRDYHITIMHSQMNKSTKGDFKPSFTGSDLKVVEKVLKLLNAMEGLPFDEVMKERVYEKDYKGTVEDAMRVMHDRIARKDANVLSRYDNLVESRRLYFDDVELECLKKDFRKYFPFKLRGLARKKFCGLPSEKVEEYIQIVEPDIRHQLHMLKSYSVDMEGSLRSLATVDFVQNFYAYQCARLAGEEPSIDSDRLGFLQSIFAPRLEMDSSR